MRVLHAPTLGWRDVDLREPLGRRHRPARPDRELGPRLRAGADVGAPRAGTTPVARRPGVRQRVRRRRRRRRDERRGAARPPQRRRRVRPRAAVARWPALLLRHRTAAGRPMSPTRRRWRATSGARSDRARATCSDRQFTVEDLVARARGGDAKAIAAIEATARYLGLGLASVINALNPACVYIGGEITLAWDLIEGAVRAALAERVLTPAAAATELRVVAADRASAPAGRRGAGHRAGVRRAGRRLTDRQKERGTNDHRNAGSIDLHRAQTPPPARAGRSRWRRARPHPSPALRPHHPRRLGRPGAVSPPGSGRPGWSVWPGAPP